MTPLNKTGARSVPENGLADASHRSGVAASVSNLGLNGLGRRPYVDAMHLLAAANVGVCFRLSGRTCTRLHEHDLGSAIIATKSLSGWMGHSGLLVTERCNRRACARTGILDTEHRRRDFHALRAGRADDYVEPVSRPGTTLAVTLIMAGPRVLIALSLVALASFGSLACSERRSTSASAATGSQGPLPASDRAYDSTPTETIRGRVIRVEQTVPREPMRRTPDGVHVTLRLESGGTIAVHLGPAWFLEDHKLELRAGDTLVVTGSRVIIDGAPALIARKITTREHELVLRDDAGVPRWSMGRRSSTPEVTTRPMTLPGRTDMSALNETEQQALRDALEDEYRAWATYDQVIRDFGPARPFTNIRDAEARHIAALHALFQRYGLEIPANTWPGRVPRFATTREACEAGIDAEVANVALYDRLIRSTNRPDILTVFGNLQRASQDRHLQAFRRCATRGGPGRDVHQ